MVEVIFPILVRLVLILANSPRDFAYVLFLEGQWQVSVTALIYGILGIIDLKPLLNPTVRAQELDTYLVDSQCV